MTGALHGVRVVDFGQYIAGPLAAMLLADQGADVIRVDPPTGPRYQVSGNATWNRGKRSIALDLKDPSDAQIARRLVDSADVLVENFRPGVMDRHGLGATDAMARNPRLIYCSMPAFAPEDERASLAGWEGIICAAAGLYATRTMVTVGRDALGNVAPVVPAAPVYTPHPVGSSFAAMLTATAAVAALLARERDGVGQHIRTPLFSAAVFAAGEPDRGVGYARDNHTPWSRHYECADGRLLFLHVKSAHLLQRFLECTGLEHWLDEFDGSVRRLAAIKDLDQIQTFIERLEQLFHTRPGQEWQDELSTAGAPATVVLSSAQWLQHPQARSGGLVVEVDDPVHGPMVQPGIAVQLSHTPGSVRAPAPSLDQHRDEILAELDVQQPPRDAGSSDAAPAARAALDGLRVLDPSIILAGPICGRTLMELGADVIKVDSPHGHTVWPLANRGKRHVFVDLKQGGAARTLLDSLIRQSDVVLQNFRPGKAEALGLGYDDVRRLRPDAVYVSLNTYGQTGPWADRPGYEYQAQASTGMQERFGAGIGVREPFLLNDFGTGVLGAFGTALALLHRLKTGHGQRVSACLAGTATLHQSAFLNSYRGKSWDQPRGQHVLGTGHLYRMYEASDGWLFVAAPHLDVAVLGALDGLEEIESTPSAQIGLLIEHHLRERTVDELVDSLGSIGVTAHRVQTVPEAVEHPVFSRSGLRRIARSDDGTVRDMIGGAVVMSGTPTRFGDAFSAANGTTSVLAEVRMDGSADELFASGVLAWDGNVRVAPERAVGAPVAAPPGPSP